MADSCKHFARGLLLHGGNRFAYVTYGCLTKAEKALVRRRNPTDLRPDRVFFYPVKKNGALAKARRILHGRPKIIRTF